MTVDAKGRDVCLREEGPDWRLFSFCQFAGPLSARMALMHARGQLAMGQSLTQVSLIGSTFTGRILGTTSLGDVPAILPEISGRGWITGIHQHLLDPSDPWPEGYRLTDTWGAG